MSTGRVTNTTSSIRVALISMPWAIFSRPSIQLGALKSFLERNDDRISVTTLHPYLDVAKALTPELYHRICLDTWTSEALYAPLLFPKQLAAAEKLATRTTCRKKDTPPFSFTETVTTLTEHLKRWISSTDWGRFDLIGFSVCFNQFFSSLAAAKAIKKQSSDTKIVFGGSFCTAEIALSLKKKFHIDFVINGEGEQPLLKLCRDLYEKKKAPAPFSTIGPSTQMDNLDSLPFPDYADYFSQMRQLFVGQPFIPTLPVEFSRGCWWNKCTFCNLNQQWRGYRAKSASRTEQEIHHLAEKHGSLDFIFTDNVLPVKDATRLFKSLSTSSADYSFFAEMRAEQCRNLPLFKKGGLSTIQVGIEAMSNSLLNRLGKGGTVIENIFAMKTAQENNIELHGNLITEFPGSTKKEVDETLKNLEYILPFFPLATATFFLGQGSPVACNPKKFGILALQTHSNYRRLLPEKIVKDLNLLLMDYRGDRTVQRKLWAPVVKKVDVWRKFHQKRTHNTSKGPPLSYRDGGPFLIIRQKLPEQPILHHRLTGTSRKIYLHCAHISSFSELCDCFKGIDKKKMKHFLDDLVKKRLMFAQDEDYLALAVHNSI